jgi:hypothetical protein
MESTERITIDHESSSMEDFTVKEQTCYILCDRIAGDCENDLGTNCVLYNDTFESIFQKERIGDVDPDAWLPEVEDEVEDEDEDEEDDDDDVDDCDEEIDIKLKDENSVSSIYDE